MNPYTFSKGIPKTEVAIKLLSDNHQSDEII